MSAYFFDTSALVKRYRNEPGSQWTQGIVAPSMGNIVVIAQITSVELMSAVSRLKREGRMSNRTAAAIRKLHMRHIQREYILIELTQGVLSLAQDLAEKHPLRAYDAVQLACALTSNQRLINTGAPQLTFVSADQRLLTIAQSEGLQIDDPNLYP